MINDINKTALYKALSNLFNTEITYADYKIQQLYGGTLGDVKLITGMAESISNENSSYKIVLKTQKKWERYGDSNSWRREYDLYNSEFDTVFSSFFYWPKCFFAKINDNEIQLWMEYIDGVSGNDLTTEMLECVAKELGHFQGRLYTQKLNSLKRFPI